MAEEIKTKHSLSAKFRKYYRSIISIMFINISIKHIGATYAAIIGALEPVTALLIGILVFHEAFTFRIAVGALLIVVAVTLVVSEKSIIVGLKRRVTF